MDHSRLLLLVLSVLTACADVHGAANSLELEEDAGEDVLDSRMAPVGEPDSGSAVADDAGAQADAAEVVVDSGTAPDAGDAAVLTPDAQTDAAVTPDAAEPEPFEVWIGVGDALMAGHGETDGMPAAYLAYLQTGRLTMVRAADDGIVPLAEPTSPEAAGSGVMGLWAWKHSVRTGKRVCVVNGGVSRASAADMAPGSDAFVALQERAMVALSNPLATLGGYVLLGGLEEAKEGGHLEWMANAGVLIADGLVAGIGNARTWGIRLPPNSPPGVRYPSYDAVRDTMYRVPGVYAVSDASGGWTADGLGLTLSGNLATAEALDARMIAADM
jgi:hypothetical protein